MANRINYYIVVTEQSKQITGTHPTYGQLKNMKILYEGRNATDANYTYRYANAGHNKFHDKHNTSIYKTINRTEPTSDNHGCVIHKV